MNNEDKLRELLQEVLTELCNCFSAFEEDDEEWLESMIARAEELGVVLD